MSKSKLPAGWIESQIGDLVAGNIEQGLPQDITEFTYIDISAVDNRLKIIVAPKTLPIVKAPSRARQQLKRGDILVSTTRPNLNAVALVPMQLDGAIASTGFAVLRPILLEPRWIYAVVQSEDFVTEMSGKVKGALYPAIRPSNVRDYIIPLPPLAEQKRILRKLSKLLTRTQNITGTLESLSELIKQYRTALLENACTGCLVPTEAELARKECREFEDASVLLERILVERRGKWEESQRAKMRTLGKEPNDDKWKERYVEPASATGLHYKRLPKGWTWASVEQCSCVMQYGTSAKTNDGQGIPVLRMGNIVDGKLHVHDLRFLPESHTEFPELLLQKGDVLFNRTNSAELVGKTAVFNETGRYSYASYLIRLRFLSGCLPEYITFFINSSHGRKWISSVAGQVTGQANVSGAKLAALAIPLPPAAEQKRIVDEVEHRLSLLEVVEQQIKAAFKESRRMRSVLFDLALTGKLVAQSRTDEPASKLLLQIRHLKNQRENLPKGRTSAVLPTKLDKLLMLTLEDVKSTHLADILLQHKCPVDAKTLWQESQLTIDDYYAQLKKELGKSLKETDENRLLEVKP